MTKHRQPKVYKCDRSPKALESMYTGDWLPRDGFGRRFSIQRAHCIAKGCIDGGRLAAASSTRAVPKVVPHMASIWLLSCGVYGGEKRSWI